MCLPYLTPHDIGETQANEYAPIPNAGNARPRSLHLRTVRAVVVPFVKWHSYHLAGRGPWQVRLYKGSAGAYLSLRKALELLSHRTWLGSGTQSACVNESIWRVAVLGIAAALGLYERTHPRARKVYTASILKYLQCVLENYRDSEFTCYHQHKTVEVQ